MMTFNLPEAVAEDFQVQVVPSPESWVVRCVGTLDFTDSSAVMQPELMRLHREVLAAKVPRVELNLAGVEYMNSSGLKGFMAWFLAVDALEPGPYRIDIVYDAKKTWQAVSLAAMERVAPRALQMKKADVK